MNCASLKLFSISEFNAYDLKKLIENSRAACESMSHVVDKIPLAPAIKKELYNSDVVLLPIIEFENVLHADKIIKIL